MREGAEFSQVDTDSGPDSCGSQCGPQCEGQCDPHAIRTGLDGLRLGTALLGLAVGASWFVPYSPWWRFTCVTLLVAALAVILTSRPRASG